MRLDLGGDGDLICSFALVNDLLGSTVGLQEVFRPAQFSLGKCPLGYTLVAASPG